MYILRTVDTKEELTKDENIDVLKNIADDFYFQDCFHGLCEPNAYEIYDTLIDKVVFKC